MKKQPAARSTAPLFRPTVSADPNPIPSSSPAFGTPLHPIRPSTTTTAAAQPTILPVILPAPTLRPIAFRTFTKKHNLTLTSSALQALAAFIGKHCGAGWREEGLAEHVLEEVARTWKKGGGGVIVDGEAEALKAILKSLEVCMCGGRIAQGSGLSRQGSFSFGGAAGEDGRINGLLERPGVSREDSQSSLGLSGLGVNDDEDEDEGMRDPRSWLKVVNAFDQPRLVYNAGKKHFERITTKPTIFPPPSHKTHLFRHRYSLIHQRLLRNDSFQPPSFRTPTASTPAQQSYKLTPIANLLGRGGTPHLLLGLLTISPTGTLAIGDLTGSIALDLSHAQPVPEDGAFFCPGMIVLVDGVYEEEYNAVAGALGGGGGVGGTIGGKFIGFSIGGPPCERREVTLGVGSGGGSAAGDAATTAAGGGFGWVDFLGVGSERALGAKMRRIESRILGAPPPDSPPAPNNNSSSNKGKLVILAEVHLDSPRALAALRKVLAHYETSSRNPPHLPLAIVLLGNFSRYPAVAGAAAGGGSIECKELFDGLANTLADHPTLLAHATFVFVPGDNDPWASSAGAGAATALPRGPIPELFTTRVKRVFAGANAEVERGGAGRREGGAAAAGPRGEPVWTSNPARLCLFGPRVEVVLFRDDVLGRLRRAAIGFRAPAAAGAEMAGAEEEGGGVGPPPTSAEAADGRGSEPMDLEPSFLPPAAESQAPTTSTSTSKPRPPHDTQHLPRKLTKTLLDQSHLSPFPLSTRPLLWDHAPTALSLYPLPTALVLADKEAPAFVVRYEGCVVMNPGPLVVGGDVGVGEAEGLGGGRRGGVARWVEFCVRRGRGVVREEVF